MKSALRRWALATPARRRLLHALTDASLRVLWRQVWVPNNPVMNEPTRLSKRIRQLWLESLPESSESSRSAFADQPSAVDPVSVMIPVGPIDVDVVALAIAGVRTNLRDPIASVTIVAPAAIARHLRDGLWNVHVIEETSVLTPDELSFVQETTPGHRAGWYVQQLVKLKWCLERSGRLTYVVDADTVLVRPQRLHTARGDVVFLAHEYNRPYFDALARLFGGDFRRPLFGTTAHQMLYRREWLRAMVDHIERVNPGRTWIEAIVDAIDARELSGFSEGECYGQWILRHHRRSLIVRRFENTPVSRRIISTSGGRFPSLIVAELAESYGARYDSVSLHHYVPV